MPRRAPHATPKVSDRPVPRFLLTVEEARIAIGHEPSTMHKLLNKGLVPYCRPFGMKGRRVKVADLAAIVESLDTVGA